MDQFGVTALLPPLTVNKMTSENLSLKVIYEKGYCNVISYLDSIESITRSALPSCATFIQFESSMLKSSTWSWLVGPKFLVEN